MRHTINDTSNPYERRFRRSGWNIKPCVTDDPRLFRVLPEFRGWTRAQHAAAAEAYAQAVRTARDAHRDAIIAAETVFGADGPLISGGLRDSWPADIKAEVRRLAHLVTDYGYRAYAHAKAARMRSLPK